MTLKKLLVLVHLDKDADGYVRAINTIIRENHPVCARRSTVIEPTFEDGELSNVWSVLHFGIDVFAYLVVGRFTGAPHVKTFIVVKCVRVAIYGSWLD